MTLWTLDIVADHAQNGRNVPQTGSKKQRQADWVTSSRPYLDWGRWVKSRAQFIGLARDIDLSKAVGCARSQLYKWFKLETPPKKFKKGLDAKLAAALKTNRAMLLNSWRLYMDVTKAPIVEGGADEDWLSSRRERIRKLERGLMVISDESFRDVEFFIRNEVNGLARKVEGLMREQERPPSK